MLDPVTAAVGLGGAGSILNTYMQWQENQYQHHLQNRIFDREDNSIQRRVADLKAAGLSPVLAAGQGAGTGGTVSTTVPQTDIGDKVLSALSLMKMEADISKTRAEEAYVNLQAKNAGQLLPVQIAQGEANIKNTDASTYRTYIDAKLAKLNTDNASDTGVAGSNIFSQAIRDTYGAASKFNAGLSKAVENAKVEAIKKAKSAPKKRVEPPQNLKRPGYRSYDVGPFGL